MKVIYVDSDFKCYVHDDGNMTAVETNFFDGKCDAFIEGYRFVPRDNIWTRHDGEVFRGEMAAPWKDYRILAAYQEQYEADNKKTAEIEAAFQYLMTGGIL